MVSKEEGLGSSETGYWGAGQCLESLSLNTDNVIYCSGDSLNTFESSCCRPRWQEKRCTIWGKDRHLLESVHFEDRNTKA